MQIPTSPDQLLSRRWFLGGTVAVAAGLAGCASSSTSSSSGTASSGTSSASAPSSASASGTAAAGSVAALAQAFYQSLTADQKPTVLLDHTLANAKRWSNLPQGLLTGGGGGGRAGGPSGGSGSSQSRLGISLSDLNDAQLAAFTSLLKAATGTGADLGYAEIERQLAADDYLKANGGGDTYGRGNFYVALLGSPQDSGTWEFQFGGHHLAIANTYTDGKLAGATPAFRGIEPNATFQLDGKSYDAPLKAKEAAFTALLAGLDADQLATAKLTDTYTDLVLGPGQDWAFPTKKDGVKVSTLSAAQKKLVSAAIATYVDDLADSAAKTIQAKYDDELDETYLAYAGTASLTNQDDYVRVDGPSVWIEFSMQHGIVLSGNHPHSVWRDRTTDYGGTKN